MKRLNEHINDSLPSGNHYRINEAAKKSSKMYFENVSSFLIYKLEISGQISDGYWENSRPYSHWKWMGYTEEIIGDKDGKYGYTGTTKHQIKYDLEWIRKNVKKALKGTAGDYDWIIRVFKYGKFASILSEKEARDLRYETSSIIEDLPQEKVTREELKAKFVDEKYSYTKEYWEKGEKYFTDEILEKYYNSKYDWSQFEDDLDSCSDSINTYLGAE